MTTGVLEDESYNLYFTQEMRSQHSCIVPDSILVSGQRGVYVAMVTAASVYVIQYDDC